ncbi:MAG: chemotaxis protein CheW [Planctomycetota bacterium]
MPSAVSQSNTSALSNLLLDKEILLESGTNELELLVFDVADYTFGINVAKVREVLPTTDITRLPRAHNSIRGVFKLRNNVIPCVSLLDHLGIAPTLGTSETTMILTDFNQQQTAFLVDSVERIHRLSWEHILSVPGLEALSHTPVTALARCEDRLIVMLDFEMILDDVTNQFFRTDSVENPLGLPRERLRILLAEDSPTVREAIGATLRSSGYTQLQFFENGAHAWQWLSESVTRLGSVDDVCDLVISDVEMPQVDGFHLTKRIKEHAAMKHLPVLLYSSIITPDNAKKGQAVGADAQVAKPELKRVVQLADELISTARRESRAAALRQVTQAASAMESKSPVSETASTPRPDPSTTSHVPPRSPLPSPSMDLFTAPGGATTVDDEAAEACPAAPAGVDPRLWQTFCNELRGRVADLRAAWAQVNGGRCGEDTLLSVARTLHTIKSASMVVPLEPVTRSTHKMESLLEPARGDRGLWPHDALLRYVNWLESICAPHSDAAAALNAGCSLP